MTLDFRFGIISDLHIALPHTVWDHPSRFHLVEVSIPALEIVLAELAELDLDFLLLPGDLTQHGEPDNHTWLAERLHQLPYPVYVVPGNHDIPCLKNNGHSIGVNDFTHYYQPFGYQDLTQLYYTCSLLPHVRLIGLNSNQFDPQGRLFGGLDQQQLIWLENALQEASEELILVMVHHNVVEHLRGQSQHGWGRRYMIKNASELIRILQRYGVQLVFTGHLHIQNIACRKGVYDITTGSLVSYPHPYRILRVTGDRHHSSGAWQIHIQSRRVEAVEEWPNLQHFSREWMANRSTPLMEQFLAADPLNFSGEQARTFAPHLRYLWADIAAGDAHLWFPEFPLAARHYLEKMNRSVSCDPDIPITSDNQTTLSLQPRSTKVGLASPALSASPLARE
ncbi:MAG: metallophosphoesterase [Cyanobacteriota bacterium]|nr:metallophosphoesterase [Cyanobacteriota bacterium]